jgi:hypothetical protein
MILSDITFASTSWRKKFSSYRCKKKTLAQMTLLRTPVDPTLGGYLIGFTEFCLNYSQGFMV